MFGRSYFEIKLAKMRYGILFAEGKFEEALGPCKEVIVKLQLLFPEKIGAYFSVVVKYAQICLKIKRTEEAASSLRTAENVLHQQADALKPLQIGYFKLARS